MKAKCAVFSDASLLVLNCLSRQSADGDQAEMPPSFSELGHHRGYR